MNWSSFKSFSMTACFSFLERARKAVQTTSAVACVLGITSTPNPIRETVREYRVSYDMAIVLLFSKIIQVDSVYRVAGHLAHPDAVIDHQLGKPLALNQDYLLTNRAHKLLGTARKV